MRTYNYKGFSVHTSNSVKMNDKVKKLLDEHLRYRTSIPVLVYHDVGRTCIGFSVRHYFGTPTKDENDWVVATPLGLGTIYCLNGISKADLSPEQIRYAEGLFFEPVWISTRKGEPCIED